MVHRSLLVLCLSLLPLSAQSYQSSFSEVKFDRSASPATWHKGFKVDVASGSLSLSFPLGPGIGIRGAEFKPSLLGYWSPQAQVMKQVQSGVELCRSASGSSYYEVNYNYEQFIPLVHTHGGFSLTPGHMQVSPGAINGSRRITYQLADGTSGRSSPRNVSTEYLPSLDAIKATLSTFGYGSEWTIAKGPFLGESGEIIVGLSSPSAPVQAEPIYRRGKNLPIPVPMIQFPSFIVVFRGDTLHEFQPALAEWRTCYPDHHIDWGDPIMSLEAWPTLREFTYVMTAVRNRVGESVKFTYSSSGYSAVFLRNGGEVGPTVKCQQLDTILYGYRLTYVENGNVVSSYQMEGQENLPDNVILSRDYYDDVYDNEKQLGSGVLSTPIEKESRWTKLTHVETGQSIEFEYGPASFTATQESAQKGDICGGVPYYVTSVSQSPFVLTAIRWNGRRTAFEWSGYLYRRNQENASQTWNGYNWTHYPAWFWGVKEVSDFDLATGKSRNTRYDRLLPAPTQANSYDQIRRSWDDVFNHWTSTAFRVAVSTPDSATTVYRYWEPLDRPVSSASTSWENQMQTMAFLKHVPQEERHYWPGQDWKADQDREADLSEAKRIVRYDRLDLRTSSNPSGTFAGGATPFPTRTRIWDAQTRLLTTGEMGVWDPVQRGWRKSYRQIQSMAAPYFGRVEMQSLAYLGGAPQGAGGDALVASEEDRAFSFNLDKSLPPLQVAGGRQTIVDRTGYGTTGGQPKSTVNLDESVPGLRRVTGYRTEGAEGTWTQVAFAPLDSTGAQWLLPASATLSGSGALALSGSVGVQSYSYDDLQLRLTGIQPKGAGYSFGQTYTGSGQPASQTDPNGLTNRFSWDSVGRILSIERPSPEIGETYTYHTDGRGVTITKGAQASELRFNGFGELALERRKSGSTWSHRLWGYDSMGRKLWETTWRTGMGDSQGRASGDPVAPGASGGADYSSATHSTYDPEGRLILVVSPNLEASQTVYDGLEKRVTIGRKWDPAQRSVVDTSDHQALSTTKFLQDASGRLVKVTDPLGRETQYSYNAQGQIAKVNQWSGLVGTLPVQSRTWEYNDLGWLTAMVQPESGRTEYSDFTVLGKPKTTRYAVVGGVPERTVTTAYDGQGRVIHVNSSDGTVNQSFQYDEGGKEAFANAKLTSTSTESGIKRVLKYNGSSGLNGRLTDLVYAVDGQEFKQKIGWNSDGMLASRGYPNGKVQSFSYDASKSLPNGTSFNSNLLASIGYDDVHWGLKAITFGNNGNSFFDYGNDQIRPIAMAHVLPSGTLKSWAYVYDGASRLKSSGEDYYQYDVLGRLVDAYVRDPFGSPTGGHWQHFQYDPFGNRKALSTRAITWSSELGAASPGFTDQGASNVPGLLNYEMNETETSAMGATNRLPVYIGGVMTGATYDGLGNLRTVYKQLGDSAPPLSMSYDALGRVASMADSSKGLQEVYSYDDQGLRIKVDVYQGQMIQKRIFNIYNEARQLVAQYEMVLE